jgi:uncharacterized protein DUF6221
MADLVQWLGAQLDADERIARAATAGPWLVDCETHAEAIIAGDGTSVIAGGRWGGEASVFGSTEDAIHIAAHDPARVLREVEAKRRIVEQHRPVGYGGVCLSLCHTRAPGQPQTWPCLTLRLLALPYADRDGYQESWRP